MIRVIGGGLAGCEAAWQLASRGHQVELWEMRPERRTAAHQTGDLAELVCSNTLKSQVFTAAPGVFKNELRMLGSLIVRCGERASIPGGRALTVDRARFSAAIAEELETAGVQRVARELTALPPASDDHWIIATGPLTSGALAGSLAELVGTRLYFYDAIAPIVDLETVDTGIAFWQNRYEEDQPGGDYLNCPMDKPTYEAFIDALLASDQLPAHEFEEERFFQGCQPIEAIAARGRESLRFGPMKPVGLRDPSTGRRPWAAVQLRRENLAGSALNMVGFQTRMRWGVQQEVLRMIPGLAEARFHRLGSIHRNTFIDSPRLLDPSLALHARRDLRFAGQITGCEGYTESSAVGLWAALSLHAELAGSPLPPPPEETALGALLRHLRTPAQGDYQPMNINFGIFPPLTGLPRGRRGRRARRLAQAQRALGAMDGWARAHGVRSAHPTPQPEEPDATSPSS